MFFSRTCVSHAKWDRQFYDHQNPSSGSPSWPDCQVNHEAIEIQATTGPNSKLHFGFLAFIASLFRVTVENKRERERLFMSLFSLHTHTHTERGQLRKGSDGVF